MISVYSSSVPLLDLGPPLVIPYEFCDPSILYSSARRSILSMPPIPSRLPVLSPPLPTQSAGDQVDCEVSEAEN